MNKRPAAPAIPTVRCAIYTRKSTEEGLEQEFNSLDAQRESAEAYIASQKGDGWVCLPQRYDDGGFTGGNMERPALKRLIADLEAGKVDCVIVYKVDRLSRSLLDFARMMETFDRRKVSFVSVTQQFNTSTSMGRLVLNVLLSFAQFEREIISERTRDKIAATKRKGKWAGGHPIFGYDVDPRTTRLTVNEDDAARVRAIFDLYLEHRSLTAVLKELDSRGWAIRRWTTKAGRERGGRPFAKVDLYRLLTNVAYLGKTRYKDEVHPGEHAAIVDPAIFEQVQARLKHNGLTAGAEVRNKFGAILKGLIRCVPCGCAMTPTHSTRDGNKRYRYYVCTAAQKRGWHTCPSKSVPAGEIERIVVDQIKCVGRDPALIQATAGQARRQDESALAEARTELGSLERELARLHAEVRKLAAPVGGNDAARSRLADLQERIGVVEGRKSAVDDRIAVIRGRLIDERDVGKVLADFGSVWGSLAPREQERLLKLLVERVDYDGSAGKVSITFHATGIKTLTDRKEAV